MRNYSFVIFTILLKMGLFSACSWKTYGQEAFQISKKFVFSVVKFGWHVIKPTEKYKYVLGTATLFAGCTVLRNCFYFRSDEFLYPNKDRRIRPVYDFLKSEYFVNQNGCK